MRPPDLVAHGFEHGGDDIGMVVDLPALPAEMPAPAGFVVERVRDEAELARGRHVRLGLQGGPVEVGWFEEMSRRIGFEGPWRHYLGRSVGEPVATSASFFGAGVAGVYCVSTVERARRRGIGVTVTLAALREARDLDFTISVFGFSEMGYPVYRRLGFREYCRIGLYEWRPW